MSKICSSAMIMILIFIACNTNNDSEIKGSMQKIYCLKENEKNNIFYKEILFYDVNEIGEIFISNLQTAKIDAYNRRGEYQYSIGSLGEGPGEFHTAISIFECTKEKIIVYDFGGRFNVFNNKGDLLFERRISDTGINGYIQEICSFKNRLIVYFINKNEYCIAVLNDKCEVDKIFVTAVKDRHLPISFLSDMEVDTNGKIYITDNYEYVIYTYDLNGKEINKFKKDIKKVRIKKSDFNIYYDHEISRHPSAENLKHLKKEDQLLPCICGINIDGNRIFVWRTDLTKNNESLIDVYDKNWNLLHKLSGYNALAKNVNKIVNRKIYTLSMKEPYPEEIAKQVGKFGLMGIPDQLCILAVPKWVY